MTSEEQAAEEKLNLLRFSSLLFYHLAKTAIDRFGEEGKAAVIEAIENFGRERGAAIRKKIDQLRLEPNLENLAKHYDLPTATLWQGETQVKSDTVMSKIEYCPLAEVWLEKDAGHIGDLYCKVDFALREAYNPDIIFESRQSIPRGDQCCELYQTLSSKK